MERKIVLRVVRRGSDSFHIQIAEQTHKGDAFGNPKCEFTSSTGWILSSYTCPELFMEDHILYTRGRDRARDETQLAVDNVVVMQRIIHAVREYNRYARISKLPAVPAEDTFIVE